MKKSTLLKNNQCPPSTFIYILVAWIMIIFVGYCVYITYKTYKTNEGNEKEGNENEIQEEYYNTRSPPFLTTMTGGKEDWIKYDSKNQKYWVIPISDEKKGIQFVDESKEFKNFCTDFVTHYFFATEDTIYEFMNLTIQSIESMLVEKRWLWNLTDKDLFLVYKGGNVLRKVFSNFTDAFPELVRTHLFDYFSPYFKRSDMDFSIYLRPSLTDYRSILLDVEQALLDVQRKMRTTYESEPTRFFNYYQYNSKYQTYLLNQLFQNMEKAKSFSDASNSMYYQKALLAVSYGSLFSTVRPIPFTFKPTYQVAVHGREDLEIRFAGDHSMHIRPLTEMGTHKAYISDNRALKFLKPSSTSSYIEFDLIRTKVDFGMILMDLENFKSNKSNSSKLKIQGQQMNGELLDVSLPKGEQNEEFFQHLEESSFSDYIVPYTLHYESDFNLEGKIEDRTINVLGYSLFYLREDLTRILFEDREYPWDDSKYSKRLHRLFLLHFINLYLESRNRKQSMEQIHQTIIDLTTSEDPEAVYLEWSAHFGNSSLSFSEFLQHIAKVSVKVKKEKMQQENFSEMMAILQEDSKTCLQVFDDLDKYFVQNAPLIRKSIYT